MGTPPQKIEDVLKRDETHLIDYLIVLAKHIRIIIYSGIAVFLLVFLIFLILPNKYTATTRLLPPQINLTMSAQLLDSLGTAATPGAGSSLAGAGGIGNMAAGLLGLKSTGELYVAIMNGNTILDRIIESFNLKKVYKEKYIEEARKTLREKVRISVGKKDGLIAIEVTDKERDRAPAMANAFAEELNKLLQALALKESKDRLAFLDRERGQANNNLMNAEDALRTFSDKNSVIQIDTQTKDMLLYIARLRAQIDAKEVQIQVMRQQVTPYNSDMVRLETEVNGLRTKLQAMEKQYDQICYGDTCLTSSKVPTLGLEYIRLYREVKFQEGLYQFYTKMAELARLDMVKDFTVVQMVDKAQLPEKRSNKRLLPALLSGFGTIFLVILGAFVYDSWQRAQLREDERQRFALLKSYVQPFSEPVTRIFIKFKKIVSKDTR